MLYLTGRTSFVIPLKSVFQLPTTAKEHVARNEIAFVEYQLSCIYSAAGIVHLAWHFVYVLVTAWFLWITFVSQLLIKTSQFSRASLYLIHPAALLTARNIAVVLEHVYGAALFILMLIVLLCLLKIYLAVTATCCEHRAFLLESTTREEQQRLNRGQRELEADRRSSAEEERPRRFERRRLPVQHDERRCLGVSIRFIKSFYDWL